MKLIPPTLLLAFFVLFPVAANAASADTPFHVWWEAETPDASENAKTNRYPPDSEYGAVLSALGSLQPRKADGPPMTARYHVELPEGGQYNLWVRKFWRHGPFQWRFNGDEWNEVGRDIALHDDAFMALHVGANWVFLGEVDLPAGEQTFEIESLDNKGFFDCFLLIDGPFLPAGNLKPGEKSGAAEPGHFAWEPDADPFAESPIDLRRLNEEYAGVHGFVRREGDHFVLGDGTPVRFWMTQADLVDLKPAMLDLHARRLAKYGVNMVRKSFMGEFKTWRGGDEAAWKQQLDRLHRKVAALKKEGIYLYFGHLFWDTHVPSLSDDDLPGLKKGERPIAAMFFNERLQDYYLEFVRDLMTPVNPHTGLSLAGDPAVAIIEVQNESNSLFWTLNRERLAPHTLELMEKAFAEFAAEKHGSLEKAFAHWQTERPGDSLEDGCAGILDAWNLTTEGYSQHPKRAADQIQFLTEAQYNTYAKMKEAFGEMGLGQMVSGSNWKTADPGTLGPLEHYSYTATDMVNRNEYFSPESIKNDRGYAVDLGDVYKPLSSMRAPQTAGPLMTAQQADWPYNVTENNWDNPSPYRAEWPFLVATYGAMAGVDGWTFFAYDTPLWISQLGVWNTNSPVILGQYPAYALMYRRGDVREGEPAVYQHIRPETLYGNQPAALPEKQYKDFVWKEELGGDPTVEFDSQVDPRAFFAGPVRLDLQSGKDELLTADLDALIDDEAGLIRNTNGQLIWNYRKGFVQVDTTTSQGAGGFLKAAGRIRTSDLVIESANEYGTLVAVSLDGRPLAESSEILIQAATREKLHGYETETVEDGALKITDLGGHPLNVETIDATVTLRGMAGRTATALDENGYPTDRPVEVRTDAAGNLVITLPSDSLYTLVR